MAKKEKPRKNEITVNGYVEEVELEDGNTGLLINDGEEDYYIVMDKIGKKLMDYIDEEVEATGDLSRKRGDLVLEVVRFNLMDDYEDMSDEDDEYDRQWDD